MKFSPKCRTKKLGMIYTILGSFCSFFNWEGADIRPQIIPGKIPSQDKTVFLNTIYDLKSTLCAYLFQNYRSSFESLGT